MQRALSSEYRCAPSLSRRTRYFLFSPPFFLGAGFHKVEDRRQTETPRFLLSRTGEGDTYACVLIPFFDQAEFLLFSEFFAFLPCVDRAYDRLSVRIL